MTNLLTNIFAQTGQFRCPGVPDCNSNTGLPTVLANQTNVNSIFQIVFGVVGAIALIVILISALRMVTSGGDPEAAKSARQTIIFASIGLVIAIMAEVIVTFVLGKV